MCSPLCPCAVNLSLYGHKALCLSSSLLDLRFSLHTQDNLRNLCKSVGVFYRKLFFPKHCHMDPVTLVFWTLGSTSFIQGVRKLFLGFCSVYCSLEILRVAGWGCHRVYLICFLFSGDHLCLCRCCYSWEDKSGPYCSVLASCCCCFKSCLFHPAGKHSN